MSERMWAAFLYIDSEKILLILILGPVQVGKCPKIQMNNQHSGYAREVRIHKARHGRNRETLKKIHAVQDCCSIIVAAAEAIRQVCSDARERFMRLRPFQDRYKNALERILRGSADIKRVLERQFGKLGTLDFAYRLTAVS